jgi:hypothetical protein
VEDAETYVSMATSKGRCSEVFVHDEEGVTKKRELEGRGAVRWGKEGRCCGGELRVVGFKEKRRGMKAE